MIPSRIRNELLAILVAGFLAPLFAQGGGYGYTDRYRILTTEWKGPNTLILNAINLTDGVQIILPQDIMVIRRNGPATCGQVFRSRQSDGKIRYEAALFIPAHGSKGIDLVALFQQNRDTEKIMVQQGGRILTLSAMTGPAFESFMNKVGELDLQATDVPGMMQRSGVPEVGVYIPFEEASELLKQMEGFLTAEGLNPPRILSAPPVQPTEAALKGKFQGAQKAIILVGTQGEVRQVRFSEEPPFGMGERIRQTILNSWSFLPATRSGETVGTEITITLSFGSPNGEAKSPPTVHEPVVKD